MEPSKNISKNWFGGLLAIVLSLLTYSPANAQFLNFDFSVFGNEGQDGMLTGEILGLQQNGTSEPSEIMVFSVNPAHGGVTGVIEDASILDALSLPVVFTPDDFTPPSSGPLAGLVTEQFTVSDGTITVANFYAEDDAGDQIVFDVPLEEGATGFTGADGGDNVHNYSGFAGATYTQVVPEPSTWALLLGCLGLLAFWRLRTADRKN